jgi:HAD superfamily 5'-nucleotidase-like hydrolase
MSRGVVADAATGTLLKLDFQDRVRLAMRGSTHLPASEILALYGDRPVAIGSDDFVEVLSPFDLPAARLFAQVQDGGRFHDKHTIGPRTVLDDIREMLDRAHTQGELKRHVVGDPGRFLTKRPGVLGSLRRLREAGKKTFLLTNSGSSYTVALLEFILGSGARCASGWREAFDLVFVDAAKPGFFVAREEPQPVFLREISDRGPVPGSLSGAALYRGGSAAALERLLGTEGEKIIFIGDNPVADCAPASAFGWRTAMVIPELETDSHRPGGVTPTNHPGAWGSIFWEGSYATRFVRVAREKTDVFAAHVESFLSRGPAGVFKTA